MLKVALNNIKLNQTNLVLNFQFSFYINLFVLGIKRGNTAVAFFTYLSQSLSLASVKKHQTIIYDSVDLNIGNGYDKKTGKFTTPSSGLYVFHVTTGSLDSSHSIVELVVNNVVKDIGWADSMDHNDRAVSSTATPVTLNEGDVVLARIGEHHGGKVIESNNYIRSSFSGFKLNNKLCDYS